MRALSCSGESLPRRWSRCSSSFSEEAVKKIKERILEHIAAPFLLICGLALLAQAAHLDVVRLAAGEIVQRRTETQLLHDTQIDLQAAAQEHRSAGAALGYHVAHLVVLDKALHHRAFRCRRYQDIQVAHGVCKVHFSIKVAEAQAHVLARALEFAAAVRAELGGQD